MWLLMYLLVVMVWVRGSRYATLFSRGGDGFCPWDACCEVGECGVLVRGGRGELRRILCRVRGCEYGADRLWLPTVARRREMRGDIGEARALVWFAENV